MTDEKDDKAPEAEQPQADTRDYEAEARREGWKDLEAWTAAGNDPARHRPAKDFVEAGEKIVPLMKAKLTRLEKKYATLEKSVQQERKATLEAMKSQNESYEARLKEALKTAVTKGDGDAVVDLQDKLADAKDKGKEIAKELKAPKDEEPVEFTEFLEENAWYATDEELKDEADALGLVLRRKNPDMPADKFFAEVARKIKAAHPDKFGRKPPAPDSSSRSSGASGSKSKGVPRDVQAQFEAMAAVIPAKDREQFLKNAAKNYLENQE